MTFTGNEKTLIVIAHPDDETLGCAHEFLRRPELCRVLHITDGAPFESRFWAQTGATTREEYAAGRKRELLAAMKVFGVDEAHLEQLAIPDREAARNLPRLISEIETRLRNIRPTVVYTHPFEGGHPDHDAAAFAARRAMLRLGDSRKEMMELREFSGYHARDGEFYCGGFLDEAGQVMEEALTPEEQARKQAALDCYRSQQRVTSRFPLSPQRWRIAPPYDFGRRPHEGPLYYEIRGAGYSFEEFATLARAAS